MDSAKKRRLFRLGVVVLAALLVEVISIIQYERVKTAMEDEMGARARVVLGAMGAEVEHMMELTEATMKENLWKVRQDLSHPDSSYTSLRYLVDDNPHVVGGFLTFVPDYFPSKGRLFEPYAKKVDGTVSLSQFAGQDHDYTENEFFRRALETKRPFWSEPYVDAADSLETLITYAAPVLDGRGRIAAICGLDMNVSWLGDTLNARQPFPSSYGLLLTQEGMLVAAPPESRASRQDVETALELIRQGGPDADGKGISIRSVQMVREPYWQVVQVYRTQEVFARIWRMRRQQVLLVLLGLAILAFMIERFARSESKLHKASVEQARIGGELAVAQRIQREMLPTSFPPFVYGSLEPAREVGGDLFDFFIRDGKLFFCIGDVAGKGVPSAMLMSVVHSLFRMVSRTEERPSQILSLLNGELCRGNDSNMFVTFFVGCLDLYSGELEYATAGHDKPFILTDEVSMMPAKANLPLGVFPDTRFEGQRCSLSPGTSLLLYTDGLTESKNVQRKQFGRDRVLEVLNTAIKSPDPTPASLVSALSGAAHAFAGQAPQSDDLTLLVVQFAPGEVLRERITLVNEMDEVERLNAFVKAFLGALHLEGKMANGLRLALEESVVNVINYAYAPGERGEVTVLADSDRKQLRFTVIDSGKPFDPTTVLEADTTLDAQDRPIGGLGILLTRKLMDSISYTRRDGQNVLSLTKLIG
ncbi:MAG: SpoIIE family protein phosphatase [Bacteroidales bacterium]|nr:SpoIIE family protein phosphatase [Bacteroidales bacterium]MBR0053281.1 SpoIIE family protein phosphatase [Bacteroidales bacterium]